MRYAAFLIPVCFLAVAAAFLIGLNRDNPNQLPSQIVGKSAPNLNLLPLGDKTFLTDDVLQKPELKIVNVFASWCVPCRVEHPNIQTLADMGIPVYGMNYKDTPNAALAFLKELGDPYTAIGQDEGRNAIEWGVYGVPETFLIDADGKVLHRHAGPITGAVLEAEILPLLSK